jgi:hypothetical protein
MMKKILFVMFFALCVIGEPTVSQTYRHTKQGFSMKLRLDNRGSFGRVAYPGVSGSGNVPNDTIGLEYPVGQPYEHIFGAGIWVGGILDTSTVGPPAPVRGVSVGYEGWSGPHFEFFPGSSAADTIFRIFKTGSGYPPKPAAWDLPSGLEGAIPYNPISDADFHTKYDDSHVTVAGHVPLKLKVFQSSYAWEDPYADAIIIFEYRIINNGEKRIDSAYVGFFFDADVGPYNVALYYQRNFTGYYRDSRTAYIHNPADRGSTPVGCTVLSTSRPLDSLRYSFRWWNGPQQPGTDAGKYDRLSSGLIDSTQSLSNLGDPRCIFGFGPFFLNPSNPPLPGLTPDTVKIAIAIVSGYDPAGNHLRIMQRNASRALDIYLNQGIQLPATPPSPPLRVEAGDRKVKLDWRWTPQDSVGGGRPNPVSNWDSTNIRVPLHPVWAGVPEYPSRIGPPYPPGFDSTSRGGRNFESFRLWRSEHPNHTDESFTLIRQWDVDGDSIEFDTGLEYEYVDSNLVRGKRYTYAVTSKSVPNFAEVQIIVNGQVQTVLVPVEALESRISTNAVVVDLPFATSTQANKVRVVPNPYRTDRDYTYESGGYEGASYDWDEGYRVIKFINLPQVCTIRVFSLAGDLIRTIEHDGGGGAFPVGDHNMPLVSESNRALASGVYIFTVESNLGTQVGKFVIIR